MKIKSEVRSIEFGFSDDPTPAVCVTRYGGAGELLTRDWFSVKNAKELLKELTLAIKDAESK